MRWVRPDLTTPANSSRFASRACARCSSAGSRSFTTAAVAAVDAGREDVVARLAGVDVIVRMDRPPRRSVARVAITSLAFMLLLVPEPVWNTSIRNSSSASRRHLFSGGADRLGHVRFGIPSSPFTCAAAALITPSAAMCAGSSPCPEMGKFSTARWVVARHLAWRAGRGPRPSNRARSGGQPRPSWAGPRRPCVAGRHRRSESLAG